MKRYIAVLLLLSASANAQDLAETIVNTCAEIVGITAGHPISETQMLHLSDCIDRLTKELGLHEKGRAKPPPSIPDNDAQN